MAGSPPTYPNYILASGGGVELGIEGDYPLHLDWEQTQRAGYRLYCFGGDIVEFLLDFLKDRNQWPLLILITGYDFVYPFQVRSYLQFIHES
jgi:hypothetical protein